MNSEEKRRCSECLSRRHSAVEASIRVSNSAVIQSPSMFASHSLAITTAPRRASVSIQFVCQIIRPDVTAYLPPEVILSYQLNQVSNDASIATLEPCAKCGITDDTL